MAEPEPVLSTSADFGNCRELRSCGSGDLFFAFAFAFFFGGRDADGADDSLSLLLSLLLLPPLVSSLERLVSSFLRASSFSLSDSLSLSLSELELEIEPLEAPLLLALLLLTLLSESKRRHKYLLRHRALSFKAYLSCSHLKRQPLSPPWVAR